MSRFCTSSPVARTCSGCPHNLGGGQGLDLLRRAGWDGRPFVTLAFGTRGYNKRWFPERETWPALARLLVGQGILPVWLGGPDEVALGQELASDAAGSLDLTGKTSIPEACAIQASAYGNVAVDTGLAHTAAATGRPTVVIVGASSENLVSPVGPEVVLLRGCAVDRRPGEFQGLETFGSVTHRVPVLRVLNALHALAGSAEGKLLSRA